MLNIYQDTLDVAASAGRAAKRIARHDSDLARQLRRAAASISLNTAEGSGLEGGNRRLRYLTALGSAREVRACFDVARAMDYVAPLADDVADRLDKVIATLVRLSPTWHVAASLDLGTARPRSDLSPLNHSGGACGKRASRWTPRKSAGAGSTSPTNSDRTSLAVTTPREARR